LDKPFDQKPISPPTSNLPDLKEQTPLGEEESD